MSPVHDDGVDLTAATNEQGMYNVMRYMFTSMYVSETALVYVPMAWLRLVGSLKL